MWQMFHIQARVAIVNYAAKVLKFKRMFVIGICEHCDKSLEFNRSSLWTLWQIFVIQALVISICEHCDKSLLQCASDFCDNPIAYVKLYQYCLSIYSLIYHYVNRVSEMRSLKILSVGNETATASEMRCWKLGHHSCLHKNIVVISHICVEDLPLGWFWLGHHSCLHKDIVVISWGRKLR